MRRWKALCTVSQGETAKYGCQLQRAILRMVERIGLAKTGYARPVRVWAGVIQALAVRPFSTVKITITSIPIHNGAQDRPQRDQGDYLLHTCRHFWTTTYRLAAQISATSTSNLLHLHRHKSITLGAVTTIDRHALRQQQ